jgi:hypothetical protein
MSQMNNEHLRVLTQELIRTPTATFKAELSKLKMRGKAGNEKKRSGE